MLSIASFVVCPLIPAIVALVLAHTSQQKIDASGGRLTGDSLNTAARIISWVNIGLCILGIVVIIIIGVAGGFDDNNDDEFDFDSLGLALSYVRARLGF